MNNCFDTESNLRSSLGLFNIQCNKERSDAILAEINQGSPGQGERLVEICKYCKGIFNQ